MIRRSVHAGTLRTYEAIEPGLLHLIAQGARTPLTLRYCMAVSQRSDAGTSSISQQGNIQTGASTSLVRLSVPPQAACTVHLELFQDGVLIKAMDQRCDGAAG